MKMMSEEGSTAKCSEQGGNQRQKKLQPPFERFVVIHVCVIEDWNEI